MRNAALILGIISGVIGLVIGFFGYGYTVVADHLSDYPDLDLVDQVENVGLIRAVSLLSPIMAIAGGAMARSYNVAAGVLLLASAAGMYWGFGFGVFTMFPIAMCALGGVLALLARQPDPH